MKVGALLGSGTAGENISLAQHFRASLRKLGIFLASGPGAPYINGAIVIDGECGVNAW
ncbi:MAG: hypothetical protein WB755_19810 [Terriglobales bacterium]